MIKSEQDHTCEFCYYELFDDKAYPCSRCVCNQPTENMWRPKPQAFGKHADVMIVDECETCRHKHDGTMGYCKTCGESNYEPKDEPQPTTDCSQTERSE